MPILSTEKIIQHEPSINIYKLLPNLYFIEKNIMTVLSKSPHSHVCLTASVTAKNPHSALSPPAY